jgi:hypothetical protein
MQRISLTLLATALLVGVVAGPAHSTIRERARVVDEPYSGGYDCGFPVGVTGVMSEAYRLREGKGQIDTAFPILDRITYEETHTNLETGAWFTVRGHAILNEVSVTPIEGSIFEFRAVQAGQPFEVYDSDGNLVAHNSGSVQVIFLFDTQGDDIPGGEYLGDVGGRVNGPHPSLSTDLCQIANALIG